MSLREEYDKNCAFLAKGTKYAFYTLINIGSGANQILNIVAIVFKMAITRS
jgi:hypothetical protein